MSADQEWSGFAQTDSWPTSSQSPRISPQPSPDSQLLEGGNLPTPESTAVNTNLSDKKSVANLQRQQQSVSPNYQQSPFISQSHQSIVKEERRIVPSSDTQQLSNPGQSFNNNCFVGTPNVRPPKPQQIASQNSPQKLPPKNFVRPTHSLPPQAPINANQSVRPVRPAPPQQCVRQVRPTANVNSQRLRAPQANQPIRQRPPLHNPQQGGIQQQQQQQPLTPSPQPSYHQAVRNPPPRQQNVPFTQNQNALPVRPPPHSNSNQIRPNPQFANQAQNQQGNVRSMSQHPQNAPNNLRPQGPTGAQRPRLAPPPVRPNFPNSNQPGNPRFESQGIRPSGPTGPPAVRHNMPHMEPGPFDDDDFYDDEDDEDMYYDDEEYDGPDGMFDQQRLPKFPSQYEDQPTDDSEGSDEEQVILEELVHCTNKERYDHLHGLLRQKGVTDEEIAEYKENYSRHNFGEEMDYYDEEMDEDDDDDDDMISSSSGIMPRNPNTFNQQQHHQNLQPQQPHHQNQQPQQPHHQNQQPQQPHHQNQQPQQPHHQNQQPQYPRQNAQPQQQQTQPPRQNTQQQPRQNTQQPLQQQSQQQQQPQQLRQNGQQPLQQQQQQLPPQIQQHHQNQQPQQQQHPQKQQSQTQQPYQQPQRLLLPKPPHHATLQVRPSQISNPTTVSVHQAQTSNQPQPSASQSSFTSTSMQLNNVRPEGPKPNISAQPVASTHEIPGQRQGSATLATLSSPLNTAPRGPPPQQAPASQQPVVRPPVPVNSYSSQFTPQASTPVNQSYSSNQTHHNTPSSFSSGNSGFSTVPTSAVIPATRSPVKSIGQALPRLSSAQSHPPPQRMPSPFLRAALSPPSDPISARQTVMQMQRSLDAEIMAKKRPPLPQNTTFPPHQQPPPFGNNPPIRAPPRMPGASPNVRHKLPPRTPIPHIPGPRHPAPTTNFNDQHAVGGPPRLPANNANPRPRHPSPQPVQRGLSPNRFPPPPASQHHPPQSMPVSNNSVPPQQTMVSSSSMRLPSPAPPPPNNQPAGPPPQHQQQQVNQPQQQQQPPPVIQQQPQQQQQMGQQQQQQQMGPQQQQQQQQPHLQGNQQQLPQISSKPDAFNLGGLSEDKCILKGRQRLVPNQLYKIRSPIDQTLVLARWNGERFEDLSALEQKQLKQGRVSSTTSTVNPQPSTPDSNAANTETPITTSVPIPAATSVASTPAIQQPSPAPQSSSNQQPAGVSNGNSDNQSTYVKPLNKETASEEKKKAEEEEDDDDDSVFKRPFSDHEDLYRVCKLCGYTSKNFKRCEGCKRIFQGEVKVHSIKKPGAPAEPSQSVERQEAKPVNDLDFYGDKDEDRVIQLGPKSATTRGRGGRGGRRPAGRGMMRRTRGGGMLGKGGFGPGDDEYDSSDSEDPFLKDLSDGSSDSQLGKKRPQRGRGKGPGARKRAKKVDEPVTVMISSDEEEPSSTSNNIYGVPPPQSPASSAGSSPIFPRMEMEPSLGYGRFRRAKMEDEEGNSKLRKKMEMQSMMPMGMDEDEDDDDEEGDEPPTYQIEIRSVRIGSMRTKPEGPLFINMRGVCFRVKSERTDEPFECEIMSTEVTHVKYYGGQGQPLLFMLLTQESGEKLRDIFHMEEGADEYLDPSSTDMKQKMVVIIIESLDYLPQDMRETLSLWADINNVPDSDFIDELSEESANDLLIHTAPPILTADVEHHMVQFKKGYMKGERSTMLMPRGPSSPQNGDHEPDSTSGSPPQQTDLRRYFDGPPIRLLQYPPPPARGIAITTEDLFCLNEGEFLNDVIIDFYLQYLHQELLSEEMQRRTHIFSSFFYKRLTQKDREKTEEDAKKSLPERRHARVKKWTKTVDLFSKDFIIVPINEHSHWYLAVICFPGLACPEVVPFIPSTYHKEELDESNSPEGETPEDGPNPNPEEGTSSQPERSGKTVFGRQLDPEKCKKSEESNYGLGQKQPCILMFDSLLGPSRNPNVKMLRDYLQCEWNAKKTETRNISKILRGSTPKVPQQNNYSDCGVYLLQYVESFFEDPIADFQIPMKGLQQWFTEDLIITKREEIHNLIMRLHRRFQEDRGDPNILDIKYESNPISPPWDAGLPPPSNHHQPLPPPPPLQSKPILPQDESADGHEDAGSNGDEGEKRGDGEGGDQEGPPKSPTFNTNIKMSNNPDKNEQKDCNNSATLMTEDEEPKPASLSQDSFMAEVDEEDKTENGDEMEVEGNELDQDQDPNSCDDINNGGVSVSASANSEGDHDQRQNEENPSQNQNDVQSPAEENEGEGLAQNDGDIESKGVDS